MNDASLAAILRHALFVSLSVPLAAVACGGTVEGTTDGDAAADASPADGGGDAVHPCENQACDSFCPAFCPPTNQCIDGRLHCECVCPDAGHDSGVVDSSRPDGSDPCHPDTSMCPYFLPIGCTGATVPDSGPTPQDCQKLCNSTSTSTFCQVIVQDAGTVVAECYQQCGVGRRPRGFQRARRVAARSALARHFAEVAQLEAASVDAFGILRDELRAHGAPERLLRLADRAARDEVRHARVTRVLARRFGVSRVPAPKIARRAPRALEAIAHENAVEGCVRETFGALVAMHQAATARDPKVRAAMARIAEDEARHAALAWEVAAWVAPRLDGAARTRVEDARREAVRALHDESRVEPSRQLVEAAGVPTAARSALMVRELSRQLWSA